MPRTRKTAKVTGKTSTRAAATKAGARVRFETIDGRFNRLPVDAARPSSNSSKAIRSNRSLRPCSRPPRRPFSKSRPS